MSAGKMTPADRFRQSTTEFLKFICDTVSDLSDEGYETTDPKALELPMAVVKKYDPPTLIGLFIDCHKDWARVHARDTSFILEVVPNTYKKIPFDVSILTIPLKKYMEWKANGLPIKGKNGEVKLSHDEEADDWPVNEEDVETMWKFFRSMIGTACNHIHLMRKPYYSGAGFTYRSPSAFKDVKLEEYVVQFGIVLDKP